MGAAAPGLAVPGFAAHFGVEIGEIGVQMDWARRNYGVSGMQSHQHPHEIGN